MEEDQRNAGIFGVLFIITFLTSIPALALYQPVLDDPAAYIAGGGEDNKIYLGALLELLSSSRMSAPPSWCSRS